MQNGSLESSGEAVHNGEVIPFRHALVFGSSGIAGWGLVNQLLSNYPAPGSFARVTATTNRPITIEHSRWPVSSQPIFSLISGVDLLNSDTEALKQHLKVEVPDIETVTHVFYFAYKMSYDPSEELVDNKAMLERALEALEALAPNVEFALIPTGTKAYGVVLPEGYFKPPFRESLPRMVGEHADQLFYYALEDVLIKWGNERDRAWCVARPDAIVGFVPNGAAYNLCGHYAKYLSLYRIVEGKGAKVSFPGIKEAYEAKYNDSSSEIIGKFSIWAAMNPHKSGGQIFNVADSSEPSRLKDHWPSIAAYFDLEGEDPSDDPDQLSPQAYIEKHADVLEKLGTSPTEVFALAAVDGWGYALGKDRTICLDKVRDAGFTEEKSPTRSWLEAFDMYRAAKMIK